MSAYRHLELLRRGRFCVVRPLNHRPLFHEEIDGPHEEIDGLVEEWNSVVDRPDCHTLVVDCSHLRVLCSEMLSELIVLQRRLKRKQGKLVLRAIRVDARRALHWTKLDRFFEIQEDAQQESVMFDVCTNARSEEALVVSANP